MSPEDVTRTFPFTVRPGHLETLDSFTRRILAVNGEAVALQNELVKAARRLDRDATWSSILGAKVGRDLAHLTSPNVLLPHAGCEACTALLTDRWACVLCNHGEQVQQHPHLDDFLCERHHRWTGPGTDANTQPATTAEAVAAHRRFQRLRRAGRIDMPLLLQVLGTLTRDLGRDTHEVFAAAVETVAWVTRRDTLRRIFDPAQPYVETFAWLTDALAGVVGAPTSATVRAVWLRLWPAHITLQSALRGYGEYHVSHPHDFALPEGIAQWFPHPDRLQTADQYLACAGLTRASAAAVSDDAPTALRPITRDTHCSKGHLYREVLTSCGAGQTPCPRCTKQHVIRGVNDLASVAPAIAAELHPTLNGDLTAGGIAAGSDRSVWWVCPEFHPYRATPANRTLAGSSARYASAGSSSSASTTLPPPTQTSLPNSTREDATTSGHTSSPRTTTRFGCGCASKGMSTERAFSSASTGNPVASARSDALAHRAAASPTPIPNWLQPGSPN